MTETPPQEGFVPALVGDYAAFENKPGEWIFGRVVECTKNPPRVRLLVDCSGQDFKVGPKHHIRVAPVSKLDPDEMTRVWHLEGPRTYDSWGAVAEMVVPCKRSQTDG